MGRTQLTEQAQLLDKMQTKLNSSSPRRGLLKIAATVIVAVATIVFVVLSQLSLSAQVSTFRGYVPSAQSFRVYQPPWGKEGGTAPHGWQKLHHAGEEHTIRLIIGLKHSNVDKLEKALGQVSDPDLREHYGNHLSLAEVNKLVAPANESVSAVMRWFQDAGISSKAIERTGNSDFMSATINAQQAGSLLQVRCMSTVLPVFVCSYVSFFEYSGRILCVRAPGSAVSNAKEGDQGTAQPFKQHN